MARLRSICSPLRRFAQVDNRRRILVVEAVAWLLLARLALIFIPFPRLARRLGAFVAPSDARAQKASTWIVQFDSGQPISARYVPSPAVVA